MIRLHVLGTPRVVGLSDPGGHRVEQPRALALLALLAAAGPHGITRERAGALLWPDSDDPHARRHLSDALYLIRRALGHAGLTGSGSMLALDDAVIVSDVGEFTRASESGRYEAAVASYGGPFLDGFHVSEAAPFEEWVSAKRQRLACQFAQALEALAEEAEAAGDQGKAIAWWQRLLEQDPLSSRVAIALGRAHLAAGDQGSAVEVLESNRGLLHRELHLDPGPVMGRALEEARSGRVPVRARSIRSSLDPDLIAVPPFSVSTDSPSLHRLAESIPAVMRAAVQNSTNLDIVDPVLVAHRWAALHPGGTDGLTTEALLGVARSVGAGLVAFGWITESDGRVWISMMLLDAPSGRLRVPPTVVDGDILHGPGLLDPLVHTVLERLRASEGRPRPDRRRVSQPPG